MPDEVDHDLLERFVLGDEAAFEALFRQFERAFWRAYRGRARFQPSRSFGAWMRRIATNAALDRLRVGRRSARAGEFDIGGPAPAPSAAADSLSMAVVPSAWGLWNMVYLRLRSRSRLSIGAHGALLVALLIPGGIGLAGLFAWKYAVGFLNNEMGIAWSARHLNGPKELNLVWVVTIGARHDPAKLAPLPLVQAAGRNVERLCFCP